PVPLITAKLQSVVQHLNVEAEDEALLRLAQRAEGGLRDAESLLDQVLAFTDGCLTAQAVNSILGLMPLETFFEMDQAGREGNFGKAFEIAHRVYSEGKDLSHFIEGLIDHFRTILLIKLSRQDGPFLSLSQEEKERYSVTARLYTQEQCLDLIDHLVASQQQIRSSNFGKVALEALLLHIMRSHYRLSIGQLVARLSQLEQCLGEKEMQGTPSSSAERPPPILPSVVAPSPPPVAVSVAKPMIAEPKPAVVEQLTLSEDPTPTPADFGNMAVKAAVQPVPVQQEQPLTLPKPIPQEQTVSRPVYEYDTLLQFAAVELEGKLQRHSH
ncbi:MAG: hypothetical protein ACHQUC_07160, partial [Chlamydiales bacterium]